MTEKVFPAVDLAELDHLGETVEEELAARAGEEVELEEHDAGNGKRTLEISGALYARLLSASQIEGCSIEAFLSEMLKKYKSNGK